MLSEFKSCSVFYCQGDNLTSVQLKTAAMLQEETYCENPDVLVL